MTKKKRVPRGLRCAWCGKPARVFVALLPHCDTSHAAPLKARSPSKAALTARQDQLRTERRLQRMVADPRTPLQRRKDKLDATRKRLADATKGNP